MPMDVSSSRPSNKANIFLGLIEYELNSLLGASHLVDYISVHIRFDLERYLLHINFPGKLQNILYLFSGQFLAFVVLICGTELKSLENACCARG